LPPERERSGQGRSPLLSSLSERVLASTRCMQFAALAVVALLAAEAWGVSNAIATHARACRAQGTSCEFSSTLATPCVEVRAPHTSQAKTSPSGANGPGRFASKSSLSSRSESPNAEALPVAADRERRCVCRQVRGGPQIAFALTTTRPERSHSCFPLRHPAF
jgi:hypothetical protein